MAEKMALLAPMPSASVAMTVAESPGLWASERADARQWSSMPRLTCAPASGWLSLSGGAFQGADRILRMSPSALRRQIGQLLIAGFNGQQVPSELRSLAKEFGLGGVILFARNIADPEQVTDLSFEAARRGPRVRAWGAGERAGAR